MSNQSRSRKIAPLARQSPNRSVARQSVWGDTAGCSWSQGQMRYVSSHRTGRRAARQGAHGNDTVDRRGIRPQGRVPPTSAANIRSSSRKVRAYGAGNRRQTVCPTAKPGADVSTVDYPYLTARQSTIGIDRFFGTSHGVVLWAPIR